MRFHIGLLPESVRTVGNQYTYDGGVLTTTPGAITVPAATYARNADGTVQVNPGTVTITATGTV